MLVVPSDRTGVGRYRSISPHVYIGEHYGEEFDVDIVYINDFPKDDLEGFFGKYDLVHIHKRLDREGKLIDMIKF